MIRAAVLAAALGFLRDVDLHPIDRPFADLTVEIGAAGVAVTVLMNVAFADGILGMQGVDPARIPDEAERTALGGSLARAFADGPSFEIDGTRATTAFSEFEVAPPPEPVLELVPRDLARALTQVRFRLDLRGAAAPEDFVLEWPWYPRHAATDSGAGGIVATLTRVVLLHGGEVKVVVFGEDTRRQALLGIDRGPAKKPAAAPARLAGTTASYHVTVTPAPAPFPFNAICGAEVSVAPRGAGSAVAGLRIDADMPGHGHGLPVVPRVVPAGAGRFHVEGLLFPMAGEWEMTVEVVAGARVEQARIPFTVAAGDAVARSPSCCDAGKDPEGPDPRPWRSLGLSDEERSLILTLSGSRHPPPDPTNRFADDVEAAAFGKSLFSDARLSSSGAISCATCHDPERAYADGRSVAHGTRVGTRNTPSLLGAARRRWYFWDGRADTLWAQAAGPLEDPREMDMPRATLRKTFAAEADLRSGYETRFGPLDAAGDDSVIANVGKALAAYERTLVSGESPFDRFVQGLRGGDAVALAALGPEALRGLRIFAGRGRCTSCHSGPDLTDEEFHNLGLAARAGAAPDAGRYVGLSRLRADPLNGLGRWSDDRSEGANAHLAFAASRLDDLGAFRTPSLRHVARTAPYFHDGRFDSLRDVVRFYSRLDDLPAIGGREDVLVPLRLSDAETGDLVAFLESL